MDTGHASHLRRLLQEQRIGSLGTLHHGRPYVSMVPFALDSQTATLIIHVSQLSPHTRDMLTTPHVSLLVIEPPGPDIPTAAVPRVTIQADVKRLDDTTSDFAAAKAIYLARFPERATTFALSDFSLMAIQPRSIQFIAGFGQAMTITADTFAQVIGKQVV